MNNQENSSIYISIKKNKIGINLTKVQNLYSENYKPILKEIRENLNRKPHTTWIRRLNTISWQYSPN